MAARTHRGPLVEPPFPLVRPTARGRVSQRPPAPVSGCAALPFFCSDPSEEPRFFLPVFFLFSDGDLRPALLAPGPDDDGNGDNGDGDDNMP